MRPQLIGTSSNSRPARAKMTVLLEPELLQQIRTQAFHNDETLGELMTRLVASAPAVAWNKPNQGQNQ